MKAAQLLFLVVVSGFAFSACAQSGVLLGIHVIGSSSAAAYQTYWIVADGNQPRVAATLADLVVPRKDGFWRVGIHEHSFNKRYEAGSIMDMPGDHPRYFEDQEAQLYIVPVGQTPKVDVTADDPEPAPKNEKPTEANPQTAADTENDDEGQPCSIQESEITYLDPQKIGLMHRSSTTEFCSPARYATFGSNELVALEKALAPSAEGVESRSILTVDGLTATQKRVIRKQVTTDLDEGFDVLSAITLTVARDKGEWVLAAWLEGSTATRGGEDFQFKIPAPASVVRAQSVPAALAAELAQIKDLTAYFVSPGGDLVVGMSGRRLTAYRVSAGKLSAPVELLQLASEETAHVLPVMAEWAAGKYVAVWDQQMKALKLPAVEVHPVKSQP